VAESIAFDGVSKEYVSGSLALREVSLAVEPGTFVVLLGPSGSGKTTLLRCLAGIERVTAGQITIGGAVVASDRVHVPPDRRNLSMVFQDYALWPHLRVRENVAFALRRLHLSKADAQTRTLAMLERVGLGPLVDRYPNELSGGEQQRVALARALVGGTGLILCDEPLSNLDADLRERMRVEISSLVRESGATASISPMIRPRRSPSPTTSVCCKLAAWCSSVGQSRSIPSRPRRSWRDSLGCLESWRFGPTEVRPTPTAP
jgi:ABC-type Fe3+/spermidine/putrescine transport system ATPase subunit